MKRFLTWLGGLLGGLAFYRALARRRALPPAPATGPDPRAEELRERLEAAARREPEPEPAAPVAGADPAARRRAVHEDARAALDELRSSEGDG
jgi:hypothetical protein